MGPCRRKLKLPKTYTRHTIDTDGSVGDVGVGTLFSLWSTKNELRENRCRGCGIQGGAIHKYILLYEYIGIYFVYMYSYSSGTVASFSPPRVSPAFCLCWLLCNNFVSFSLFLFFAAVDSATPLRNSVPVGLVQSQPARSANGLPGERRNAQVAATAVVRFAAARITRCTSNPMAVL